MPGYDGYGPDGRGPLTGRGFGYCRNSGRGFRRGFGRGYGFRRAFRDDYDLSYERLPYERPLTKIEEKKILEEELKDLDEEKKAIQNKLKELKD